MAAMEQWKYLRQSDERLPDLLVKGFSSKSGYSIRLTDLSRIWAENLDKDDIIARARSCNCSIDPSEDVEQYQIFLEKLQSALHQHDKTKLTLSTTKDGDLQLHLEAPLPSPLPAFEWDINLKQTSGSSVELDIVSPLLRQAHNLNRQIQSLIGDLQSKDKVISKLIDRLETSGQGLADIFPGAANVKLSGKKSQQQQFARHVRGLGKFDEDAWAADFAASSDTLPRESANAVFASLPRVTADTAEHGTSTGWWQHLPHGRHIVLDEAGTGDTEAAQSRKIHQDQNLKQSSKSDVGIDNDGDDFQRQATPPHLRDNSRLAATKDNVHIGDADDTPPQQEDSTEDEDDLDGPPPKRNSAHKPVDYDNTHMQAHTKAKTKTSSPPPVVNPTAHAPTTRGPFTHEEDTEDDDDLDGPSQASEKPTSASQLPSHQKSQTPQPSLSTALSPRKRLGTLGGRARTKSPTPMSITPTEEEKDPEPSSPSPGKPKPKGKLGMIGGSKSRPHAASPTTASTDADTPMPLPGKKIGTIGGKRETNASRAATASATPEPQDKDPANKMKEETKAEPIEPEDPVERANAKRDALKRELDAKAKAPVKKKRKF